MIDKAGGQKTRRQWIGERYETIVESGKIFPWWAWIIAFLLLLLFGLVHGCFSMLMPMHLYFMWAIIIRLCIFWSVHESTDKKAFLQKIPQIKWTWLKGGITIFFAGLILVLLLAWPGFIPRTIGFTRANVMKSSVTEFKLGNVEMFPEIQPEELRLTTSGIARSIAETKKTSGASSITGTHLGEDNRTLSWISTVSETPVLGYFLIGDSNRIREKIVIPVTDATGEKAKVIDSKMFFAEGLWWQKDIRVHGTDRFPLRTFSRGYITENNEGESVAVTTSYFAMPFGALYDPKVHIWDPITGDLLGEYTPNDAPAWVVQRWDESYVEIMGDKFGDFRLTANNDLNYWIGTLYFSDRSADPSEPEGLRYQMWYNETTAVYIFDNKKNEEVMELLIIATKEGMTVYSMDHLKFIGADDAKETAISGLPALTGERTYKTPIALLYRIDSEVYYHIPIYTYSGGHYFPVHFALVRAYDRYLVRRSCDDYGGMIGAVKAAYEYVKGVPGPEPTEGTVINGTITEIHEPRTIEGSDEQFFIIEPDEGEGVRLLVKYALITDDERFTFVSAKVGDWISVKVDKDNIVLEVLP